MMIYKYIQQRKRHCTVGKCSTMVLVSLLWFCCFFSLPFSSTAFLSKPAIFRKAEDPLVQLVQSPLGNKRTRFTTISTSTTINTRSLQVSTLRDLLTIGTRKVITNNKESQKSNSIQRAPTKVVRMDHDDNDNNNNNSKSTNQIKTQLPSPSLNFIDTINESRELGTSLNSM